jgi:ComF family protein
MNQVYQRLHTILATLFPDTCVLCGAPGWQGLDLCARCHADLPHNDHPCPRCALPLPAAAQSLCGMCQKHPPAFDHACIPLRYEGATAHLVTGLKFHGQMNHARLMGELLYQAVRHQDLPDCLIAVPLHIRRQRQRGFNQALEIARTCARRLALPLDCTSLARTTATRAQTRLTARERQKNPRGAFRIVRNIQAKHIALIDDVVTTGSTVNEIAKLLKSAGIRRVDIWAVARTP